MPVVMPRVLSTGRGEGRGTRGEAPRVRLSQSDTARFIVARSTTVTILHNILRLQECVARHQVMRTKIRCTIDCVLPIGILQKLYNYPALDLLDKHHFNPYSKSDLMEGA